MRHIYGDRVVTAEDGEPRFYGKFRGVVVVNIDPDDRARIMVHVPEVLGDSQRGHYRAFTTHSPKRSRAFRRLEPECG